MTRNERVGKLLHAGAVLVAAAAVAVVGCAVNIGGGGTGALSGTVTNSATDAVIEGAMLTLDPAVEGVTLTTDDMGQYSASLPSGVYEVTVSADGFTPDSRVIAINSNDAETLDFALDPMQAAMVSIEVDGDAAPGETLTLRANVVVLDGQATVQGYSWEQTHSVPVTISGANSATASVTLPDRDVFKDELFMVLAEPPITQEQLPPNVVLPEGEFPGGLQDRFYVVGLNPFNLEMAGHVALKVTVTTSAGTFEQEVDLHAELPWDWTTGIRNVPIEVPVLLHGKTQDTYDWALSAPAGSSATLMDATTQNPEFTPDVAGLYRITATDMTGETDADVVIEIYAGTWEGAISGQDENGRPLSANCTACHNGTIASDTFTPWKETGHAEIFTDSINTSDHYSTSCVVCHTVGYDPDVDNGGFDDASDYDAFLAEFTEDGAHFHSAPGNWDQMLDEMPNTAQLANIQCENCHGPQNGGAHTQADFRISISSDVCGYCHGEPLRHGRFQQWQLSGHANYELAIEEGENGNCARCHTGNGFLAWLPVLLDDDPATDPLDNVEVTWTRDETHPQTCVTCHDPHSVGSTTGEGTNAPVRITDNTPMLTSGFAVLGAGKGAICMTCHNSRRGLRNDETFPNFVGTSDLGRAPHPAVQTDVLMGQNAYFVETGIRGPHALVDDTCVTCHMSSTPPPNLLAYNEGGTNHTFFAAPDICADCHGEFETADSLQIAFEQASHELEELIVDGWVDLFGEVIGNGNTIELGDAATLTDADDVTDIEFTESHGQMALTISLVGGQVVEFVTLSSIVVMDGANEVGPIYTLADARLIKSGWNLILVHADGSEGVHNPTFVFNAIDSAIDAMNELLAE